MGKPMTDTEREMLRRWLQREEAQRDRARAYVATYRAKKRAVAEEQRAVAEEQRARSRVYMAAYRAKKRAAAEVSTDKDCDARH